jgi:hypothetical protein
MYDRQPVEHVPDRWRGELDGHHIRYGRDPIPVTVRIQWTDGTQGEVNGWTSQWTRTHVCVVRESAPPYHPLWVRAPQTCGGERSKNLDIGAGSGSALPPVSDGPRRRASGVGCSASGVHGVLCVPVVWLAGVGVDLR